jgi:hypothetical protein
VLSAERRDLGEKVVGNDFAARAQLVDGATEIAARAKGSKPGRPPLNQEKLSAALMLVKGGMSPTQAARPTGLGRSTVYREIQSRPNA